MSFMDVWYADDILLLAHSLNAMRHMMQVCEHFAIDLDIIDIKFNSTRTGNKYVVLTNGCRYNVGCEPLQLATEKKLKFVVLLKYLGIDIGLCVKAFNGWTLKVLSCFSCIILKE